MSNPNAKDKVDQVVGRALRDEEFRNRLQSDPKGTLKGVGLTDDDLESVSGGAFDAFLQGSAASSLNFSKIFAKGTSLQGLQGQAVQDFNFKKTQ
jgi:hypothetical protein